MIAFSARREHCARPSESEKGVSDWHRAPWSVWCEATIATTLAGSVPSNASSPERTPSSQVVYFFLVRVDKVVPHPRLSEAVRALRCFASNAYLGRRATR